MPTLLELATTTSLLNSSCFNQKLQNRAKFQKSWTNRRLRVHISEIEVSNLVQEATFANLSPETEARERNDASDSKRAGIW